MSAHHSIAFPTAQHQGLHALRSLAGHPVPPRANSARRLSIRCGGALLSHRFKSSGVCIAAVPKNSTRFFADAQKVFDGSSNVQ